MHNSGFYGFGLDALVLCVNPSKNMITMLLGTDRFKDYDILLNNWYLSELTSTSAIEMLSQI